MTTKTEKTYDEIKAEQEAQAEKCLIKSRYEARKLQNFIKVHTDKGHHATTASAVLLVGETLRVNLARDEFSKQEFMLEIDRIVNELGITASWFWGRF